MGKAVDELHQWRPHSVLMCHTPPKRLTGTDLDPPLVSRQLGLFGHRYECWPQLKVIHLHSRFSDAWWNALNSRSYVISECPSLTSCSCVHLWRFFLSITPLLKPLLLSPYAKVLSISGLSSNANELRIKGKIGLQAQNQHYQSNQN